MQFAKQRTADRAAMGEPFRGLTVDHAVAFGGRVILVDDRTPPLDHLFLYWHRTWCGPVDRGLQRREVVTATDLFGKFEHPREHGRHEHAVCDAIALHKFQEMLGIAWRRRGIRPRSAWRETGLLLRLDPAPCRRRPGRRRGYSIRSAGTVPM